MTRVAGKLGRLPHDPHRDLLRLGPHLTGTLPAAPPMTDWLSRVPSWPMYDNDRWGDCAWAMIGHVIEALSTYGEGTTVTVTTDDLIKGYSAVTGFDPSAGDPGQNPTDQGTVLADALDYWRTVGIGGDEAAGVEPHKILAYAQVDIGDAAEIDAALKIFGHLCLGVNFPNIGMQQFENGQPWDVVPDDGGSDGGHAFNVGLYDVAGKLRKGVSWAEVQGLTDAWWGQYVEEAFVVITEEWLDATGHNPDGVDLHGLGEDLSALTGDVNPFPDPTPDPTPPAPTPDPTPTPTPDPGPTPDPTPPPDPTPSPVTDDADRQLVSTVRPWLRERHHAENRRLAEALRRWMRKKGLS